MTKWLRVSLGVLISVCFLGLWACGSEPEGGAGNTAEDVSGEVETPDADATPDVTPDVTPDATLGLGPLNEDGERVCGGIAGFACGEGEYCQMAEGTCHIADNMGVCKVQPEMCTRDYRPVCGCDGTTYGNACTAAAAGVSIDHVGECSET